MIARAWLIVSVAGAFTTGIQQPSPPPGSQADARPAAVSGVVTDTAGKPLGGAAVWLTSSTGSRGLEMTDAKGRFVFTGVAPGPTLSISASKPGYLTGNLGETAAGIRTTFALAPGQWMNTANITLLRLS